MTTLLLQYRHFDTFFTEKRWQEIAQRLELSSRELSIVRLVFEEAEEQDIAARFGTSVNTVRTQLRRLYRKLGVQSRVGLVLRIVRGHLDDRDEAEHCQPKLPLHNGGRTAA